MLQPYITWSRAELWKHCEKVINHYDPDHTEEYNQLRMDTHQACFSIHWYPMRDYNGCNVIQDPHHPHPACLVHDFNWIVNDGGKEYDLKFEYYNKLLGIDKAQAAKWYKGVRLGWWFWYKWVKIFEK